MSISIAFTFIIIIWLGSRWRDGEKLGKMAGIAIEIGGSICGRHCGEVSEGNAANF